MTSSHQVELLLPLTSLVGREREISDLHDLLVCSAVRLVTLTGAGGAGKTRLARRVAADVSGRFADGWRFVSLAPIRAADLVVPAIARALGIPEATRASVLDHLIASLAARQFLLVLDNFEQVLEAGPAVAELLTACPRLTLLVTSRIALHLSGEHEVAVPPLPFPDAAGAWTAEQIARCDAVRLFVERAQAVQSDFALTPANAADIARICARLDGLPLAIELAAARVKLLPLPALVRRLDRRLPLLIGGPRDAPARLRTMRDAIAWSYDLLDTPDRRLFRRLAVFANGFTLAAAARIAEPDGSASSTMLDGIASLVDQSLVVPVPTSVDASAGEATVEPRFTMLETIREFALERLAESGEEPATRRAHAEYFRELAECAEPELRGAHRW
jgi:predicted ATPase